MNIRTQLLLDKVSIGVSTICAIQCALMPILLVLSPNIFLANVDEHFFHLLLIWLVLPTSALACFLGCSKHSDKIVLFGIVSGLFTLVFAAVFGHDLLGEIGEKVVTILAAVILALAHWRNYKLCRKNICSDCPED